MQRLGKLTLVMLILFLFPSVLLAQQECNNWYFGAREGLVGLDFNFSPPKTMAPIPSFRPSYNDITSSISGPDGKLLVATDGEKAYNKLGQMLENGELQFGATYNTLIVPRPGQAHRFYIFAISQMGNPTYLHYTEIDVAENGGQGKLLSKHNYLFANATRRLAAVKHCNNKDFWVVSTELGTNRFYAYLVSEGGICNRPVISSAGQPQSPQDGNMKFSPNGRRLVTVAQFHDTQVFDFNPKTGQVSLQILIPKDQFGSANGFTSDYFSASFSPDNSKLYVSSGSWKALDGRCAKLVQYDLKAADVVGSHYQIYDNLRNSDNNAPGAPCLTDGVGDIQLGPDGKIYVSNPGRSLLHVITNPNEKGEKLDFVMDGLYLIGGVTSWHLPNFVESYLQEPGSNLSCPIAEGDVTFNYQNNCFSQSSSFSIDFKGNGPYSVEWNFGDPQSLSENTSNELNPFHTFSAPGNYDVTLTLYSLYNCTLVQKITGVIKIKPAIPVDLGPDRVLCGNEEIILDATTQTALSYKWSDGSTASTLRVKEPGAYWVEVDQGECTIKDNVLVTKAYEITTDIGTDSTLCEGDLFVLDATTPEATYYWNNGSHDSILYITTPGTYEVTITNACFTSVQSVNITFRDCHDPTWGMLECNGINEANIPNIFTPNNDGKNDYFGIAESTGLKEYSLEVYNRTGFKVFESSPNRNQWDGNGAASGVYFYLIRFQCGESKKIVRRVVKGSLTLLR
jgi:gliding motility-associated-like protein